MSLALHTPSAVVRRRTPFEFARAELPIPPLDRRVGMVVLANQEARRLSDANPDKGWPLREIKRSLIRQAARRGVAIEFS